MAKMLEGKHAQDWISLVLAVVLFISPWVLGFAAEQYASWNAWVCAAVVGLVAMGAISLFKEWEEWLILLVGVWLIAAPWVLGFSALTAALSAHVVLGLLIAVAAAWEIWEVRHEPQVTA